MVVLGWGAVSYERGTPVQAHAWEELAAEKEALNQVHFRANRPL